MARTRKTPQEKKRLSLEKDRRNVYGESDKGSRKNIPKSKAISHRKNRRKSTELEKTLTAATEDVAEIIESTLTKRSLQKPDWKKSPDAPLGEFIEQQREMADARERNNRLKVDLTPIVIKQYKPSD